MVLILGRNAQGKSNLLEAAYLLAIGKSYHANTDRELIRLKGLEEFPLLSSDQALITGDVEHRDGHLNVIIGLNATPKEGVRITQVHKQIRVNGVPTSTTGLVGRINAVLFTASDIDLVLGAPSGRRRFLDILISQADRRYLRALQRYQRIITQRNHLLRLIRENRGSREELDFWDLELVREGTTIISRRDQVLREIIPFAEQAYSGLVGNKEEISLAFQPIVSACGLEEELRGHREREIAAGMTLYGPHRDNLLLEVDGMNAATYASRGQARTIALALRLAEALFLKQERGEEPILLLDDVLSELDPQRRQLVMEEAGRYQQALATAAEPTLVSDTAVPISAIFTAEGGQIRPS